MTATDMDAVQLMEHELSSVESLLISLETRVQEINTQRHDLEIRGKLLRELLSRLKKLAETIPDQGNAVASSKSTTSQILELLEHHPEGLTSGEVADQLQNKIDSTSSNKRKLIQNTMTNLRNEGRLVQIDNGRYRVSE